MATVTTSRTATIGVTAYSICNGTTTFGAVYSEAATCWLMVDAAAMAAGDEFLIEVLLKIGATTRVMQRYTLKDTNEIVAFGPFPAAGSSSYDVSIKKIAGTDRSLSMALNRDISDTILTASSLDDLRVSFESNPKVFKQSEATAVRRRVYFRIPLQGGGESTVINALSLTSLCVRKNGGTAVAAAGATSRIAIDSFRAYHYYEFTAAELNTLGVATIEVHVAGTGNPVENVYHVQVVAYDPYDPAALGLSNLNATISSRLAPSTAGNTLNVNASGEVVALAATAYTAIVTALLAATVYTGVTVVGALRRVVSFATGSATGITGTATATFNKPDGTTAWTAAQNPTAGTRGAGSVGTLDTP